MQDDSASSTLSPASRARSSAAWPPADGSRIGSDRALRGSAQPHTTSANRAARGPRFQVHRARCSSFQADSSRASKVSCRVGAAEQQASKSRLRLRMRPVGFAHHHASFALSRARARTHTNTLGQHLIEMWPTNVVSSRRNRAPPSKSRGGL